MWAAFIILVILDEKLLDLMTAGGPVGDDVIIIPTDFQKKIQKKNQFKNVLLNDSKAMIMDPEMNNKQHF